MCVVCYGATVCGGRSLNFCIFRSSPDAERAKMEGQRGKWWPFFEKGGRGKKWKDRDPFLLELLVWFDRDTRWSTESPFTLDLWYLSLALSPLSLSLFTSLPSRLWTSDAVRFISTPSVVTLGSDTYAQSTHTLKIELSGKGWPLQDSFPPPLRQQIFTQLLGYSLCMRALIRVICPLFL